MNKKTNNVSFRIEKGLNKLLSIIMRGFILFLCFGITSIYANYSNAQNKITLQVNEVSFEQLFKEIQVKSNYIFFYKDELIDLERKISINVKESSIESILDDVFSGTSITYQVLERQIALSKKEPVKKNNRHPEIAINEIEQTKKVSGLVTDVEGIPLPGVNVKVVGTNKGTETDFDGNYSIKVNEGDVLELSYIGMKTTRVVVGSSNKLDVVLQDDTNSLDEVVVVGYGSQTRKTTAGAVAQVSGEVLEDRPITSVIGGLQGVLPGLTINRSSGQPGQEGFSLQVRGISSINGAGGNSPLILIDGVEGDINTVNPNDIKTTTLLKDASAAIYGARAAGGVLLITTKTGRKNQSLKIKYNSSFSFNKISNQVNFVNMKEFADMDIAAAAATGGTSDWATPALYEKILDGSGEAFARWGAGDPARLFFRMTDWQGAVLGDGGTQQSHNLSITGGGEKSDYAVSFGYNKIDGILRDAWDSSRRLNLRMNLGYDLTEKLRFETKISYENQNTVQPVGGSNNIIHSMNYAFRWLPIYNKNGDYFTQWGFTNAKMLTDKNSGKRTSIDENLRANFKLSYEVLEGLKIHGQVGVNRGLGFLSEYNRALPNLSWEGVQQGWTRNKNGATEASSQVNYKNVTSFLEYRKTFGDKHDLSVMAGASHEENDSKGFRAWRTDFTQDKLWSLNLGDSEEQFNTANASDWAIRSYFGRLTYVFDSKYIAEINYRRDGTSVFSPKKRWGDFYGASLAWVASEESFIQDLGVFDNLKFRLSRGTTGNQNLNSGNLYDYVALVNIGGQYPFGNTERAPGAWERGLVSQNRTWEDLVATNFGFDFEILDSKLFGSFDIYKKENTNMLLGVNLPSVLGGNPPTQNVGALETKGFELALGWRDQVTKDFSYSVTVTLDDNSNVLTNLDGRDLVRLGSNTRQGYALGTIFGYDFDGFIQNQEELDAYKALGGVPGDIGIGDTRFRDINGDGKISLVDDNGKDADIVNLGTNAARYNYSITLTAKYKNFDFSTFIQGVGKRTVFYNGDNSMPWTWPWRTPLKRFVGNTWTPENRNAKYPRLTHGGIRWWDYSTSEMNKVNGAYLRFKNISLGYTIPKTALEQMGLSNLRIFFSGEDMFTIDHVDGGYDAENTNGASSNYPFMKRYSLGLSLTF